MSSYPDRFEVFWKAYPRKVAKPAAARAWEKNGIEDDMYMAAAATHDAEKRSRLRWWPRDKTKIPHPATWINAHRWEDEGWEDEINNSDDHIPVSTDYRARQKDKGQEPEFSWEETMLNRIGKNYIFASGGLPDTDKALACKKEIMERDVPAFRTDLEAETIDRPEAAETLVKLFLDRLDSAYGLNLSGRVYRLSLIKR